MTPELNENNVFTSDIAATGESMTAIKAKLPDDKVTSFQSSSSSSQIRDNYGLESGSTSDVKRELENTAGSEEHQWTRKLWIRLTFSVWNQ